MQIPKRFKLCGQTIEVVFDELLIHKNDNRGEAVYRDNMIKLMPAVTGNPTPQTAIEEAFCHEMTHFLLHTAGYRDEASDEAMVFRLGHLLHQALTTMEYDKA